MKDEKVDIIIIRGAPASGKSTSAKALSKYFPSGVRMEVDTLRSMVISVDWTNQAEHISILNLSIGLVIDFLQKNYQPVIVIDTFSGNKLDSYIERLLQTNKKLIIKIFGLYTSTEELEKRIASRKENEFKDFQICCKLNEDTLRYKHVDEFQIDTTGLSPDEVGKIIFNHIVS